MSHHICTCADCNPRPYEDRCKFEAALGLSGEAHEELRGIVFDWINQGFRDGGYTAEQYDIFEALGILGYEASEQRRLTRSGEHLIYDIRRRLG